MIFLLLSFTLAKAQISFQFLPELNGRTIDGMFQVKIINNSGAPFLARLTMSIKAKGNLQIVKIIANYVSVNTGLNTLSPSVAHNALIQFNESELSKIVKQSNFLPEAEYEYCFMLEEQKSDANRTAQECYNYYLEPFSPLSLIEPFNNQEMCDKKPNFLWQPIFPAISGMHYQMVLAEIKNNQNAIEALYYNIPIINLRNVNTTMLPYPSIAKNLDSGKNYVWQVSAYQGNMVLSRSEIWTFKVNCPIEKQIFIDDGYRNLEDLLTGNYYVAHEKILFFLDNPYTEREMKYSIICLSDPGIRIKKLPMIKLMRGRNNVVIPLTNERIFKDGYSYVMKVKLPNGLDRTLRFTYKTK